MLSGGVDSSVAAAKLLEEGFEVTCAYMKCWSKTQLEKLDLPESLYACQWEDDLEDARNVAKKLGVELQVLDFQQQYLDKVINYLLTEYSLGRTPNPDIMCNSLIKFGVMYDYFLTTGLDYLATGHYAKTTELSLWQNHVVLAGKLITRSSDLNKDQSYFLARIQPAALARCLFPIGDFASKQDVRKYAEESGLITSSKKDSQGLCFVGQTPLRKLLQEKLGEKLGEIKEITTEKVLGTHPGAHLYTIGQREKLGLAGGPWFVTKIDILENVVWVCHSTQKQSLQSKIIKLTELHFFVDLKPEQTIEGLAQIRYRQTAQSASLKILDINSAVVTFSQPVSAAAKGQTLAFYDQDKLVFSGVIS